MDNAVAMTIIKTIAPVLGLALLVSGGCRTLATTPEGARGGKVTGKVYYQQRIALPKETKLVVKLVDMTDSGSPRTLESAGRTIGMLNPAEFEMSFSPGAIREGGVYQVVASLELPDGGRWWHEQTYPVLTGNAPAYVEIRVYPKR